MNSVKTTTRVLFGLENKFRAIIQHAPFAVDFQIEGETHVQLNSRGLLNLEHWRPRKHTHEAKTEEDESTWWEESFDRHTDSKPRGPESVGMDVSFPGYNHVFGIPEHADALLLKETRYVLFENLDKYQIPYDAIWLDIEYTDGRKYFTWDPLSFTNPEGMQEALMEPERKLVVLIDPHIKRQKIVTLSLENLEHRAWLSWIRRAKSTMLIVGPVFQIGSIPLILPHIIGGALFISMIDSRALYQISILRMI